MNKSNQVFVAMKFSDETISVYENAMKPAIEAMKYSALRVDMEEFDGSIINKVTEEIKNSIALVADLTGNRGGVYYEAGVARGLQLCNHPIRLILVCEETFFKSENVHFDVKGDNIIVYKNENDLKQRLVNRLKCLA